MSWTNNPSGGNFFKDFYFQPGDGRRGERQVIIQVEGMGTYRVFLTQEEIEQVLTWGTDRSRSWAREKAEAQERAQRLREEKRRMQEEQNARRRDEERARQRREQERARYHANFFVDEEFIRSMFDEGGPFSGFKFYGTDDGYRESPPKQEHKSSTPPKREVPKAWTRDQMIKRLCELAKVDYPSELGDKRLLRRAQRECHPDSGGSHELWVELDELVRLLRI